MKFQPGDRVIVPWGLEEIEGTVIDVFGPSGSPFATVRVALAGSGEESDLEDLNFRADILKPVHALA